MAIGRSVERKSAAIGSMKASGVKGRWKASAGMVKKARPGFLRAGFVPGALKF
jgi:hypothetical protein